MLTVDNRIKERIFGLDLLRALAIFFVVFGHGAFFFTTNVYIQNIFNYIIFDGVSIFFVLSGFLIGNILISDLKENNLSFAAILRFWKRRWLRTIPAYYSVLTIVIIISKINSLDIPNNILLYYLFSQNIVYGHPNFFNEAWSLSIEEWFYLILPISILIKSIILKSAIKTVFLTTTISIIIAVILIRIYRFIHFPTNIISNWDTYFRKIVILRLDSIAFGVLGAYIAVYYKIFFYKFRRLLLITGIILLIADKFIMIYDQELFGKFYLCVCSFLTNSLGTLLLVPYLTTFKTNFKQLHKLITFTAEISYSLYLTNYTLVIMIIMPGLFNFSQKYDTTLGTQTYYFIMYIAVTFLLSVILNKTIEKPFMKLRN